MLDERALVTSAFETDSVGAAHKNCTDDDSEHELSKTSTRMEEASCRGGQNKKASGSSLCEVILAHNTIAQNEMKKVVLPQRRATGDGRPKSLAAISMLAMHAACHLQRSCVPPVDISSSISSDCGGSLGRYEAYASGVDAQTPVTTHSPLHTDIKEKWKNKRV